MLVPEVYVSVRLVGTFLSVRRNVVDSMLLLRSSWWSSWGVALRGDRLLLDVVFTVFLNCLVLGRFVGSRSTLPSLTATAPSCPAGGGAHVCAGLLVGG